MSTFDGSKVNGLANALQSQMAASAPLNSPEFFDYIQKNYTNTFRNEIASLDFEYVNTMFNTCACRSFTVKVPIYSYNPDTGSWSEEAVQGDLPLIMCFNVIDHQGFVNILFGNYVFKLKVSIQEDSSTGETVVVIGEHHWYKISLN